MCVRSSVGPWRAALLLLLLLGLGAADLERRADLSPMPFVMGSRYGRSPEPRLLSPRNDRFFMGSRYGKRSENGNNAGDKTSAILGSGAGASLLCEYTGVFPLYRCVRHDRRDHYDARSADEAGMTEEQ